jgi:hypothetical protein
MNIFHGKHMKLCAHVIMLASASCVNFEARVEASPEITSNTSSDSSADAKNENKIEQELAQLKRQLSDLSASNEWRGQPRDSLEENARLNSRVEELEAKLADRGNSYYQEQEEGLAAGRRTFKVYGGPSLTAGAEIGYFITDSVELLAGTQSNNYVGTSWGRYQSTNGYDDVYSFETEKRPDWLINLGMRYFPLRDSAFKPYLCAKYGISLDDDQSAWDITPRGNTFVIELGSYLNITNSFFFDFGISIPIISQTADVYSSSYQYNNGGGIVTETESRGFEYDWGPEPYIGFVWSF